MSASFFGGIYEKYKIFIVIVTHNFCTSATDRTDDQYDWIDRYSWVRNDKDYKAIDTLYRGYEAEMRTDFEKKLEKIPRIFTGATWRKEYENLLEEYSYKNFIKASRDNSKLLAHFKNLAKKCEDKECPPEILEMIAEVIGCKIKPAIWIRKRILDVEQNASDKEKITGE